MQTTKNEHITQAFILTPDEIQKLLTLFSVNTVSFKTTSVDKLEREFQSVDDLIQFESPPAKRITSLWIYSFTAASKMSVWFHDRDSSNIYVTVEGEEEDVIRFLDGLCVRLQSMKPWYAFIARIGPLLIPFLLVQSILIALAIRNAFHNQTTLPQLGTALSSVRVSMLMLALLGVLALLVAGSAALGGIQNLLTRLLRRAFPMGVFLIGQGLKRHQEKELLRSIVILGFLVSVVAGVVVTVLVRYAIDLF